MFESVIAGVTDYLLLYARDKDRLKYRQLYRDKQFGGEGASAYGRAEFPGGVRRSLTPVESRKVVPGNVSKSRAALVD